MYGETWLNMNHCWCNMTTFLDVNVHDFNLTRIVTVQCSTAPIHTRITLRRCVVQMNLAAIFHVHASMLTVGKATNSKQFVSHVIQKSKDRIRVKCNLFPVVDNISLIYEQFFCARWYGGHYFVDCSCEAVRR